MTYEEKRAFMLEIDHQVSLKAEKADLYYVICFWISPITEGIEHRQAYFDEFSEAINYQTSMIKQYKNRKYFITSNLSSGNTDGGLL